MHHGDCILTRKIAPSDNAHQNLVIGNEDQFLVNVTSEAGSEDRWQVLSPVGAWSGCGCMREAMLLATTIPVNADQRTQNRCCGEHSQTVLILELGNVFGSIPLVLC